jgi:hypothetical protein
MASTYSDLKIELIATGEQSGSWGTTTNTNLGTALTEAITGSADVAFSSADVTLTLIDTNNAQTARNLRLNLTGTSGGARNLILGSGCQIEKLYLVNNGLADAVTVKNTSGTGIAVPAGKTMFVYNNGTNVVEALNYFAGEVAATSITASGNTALSGNLTVDGNTTLGNASGDTITLNAATATIPNNLNFNGTGTVTLPNGTTVQRPTPAAGMIRYNTTTNLFEGYTTRWGGIGGASANAAIYENAQSITENYTMTTNFNGESVGPITIASGVTVTIPSGSRYVIL